MNNPTHYQKNKYCLQGFSLIEMSIVLVIMSLIAGSGLHVLNDQLEHRRERVTHDRLQEARQALLHFAKTYGRLPCPSIAINATESRKIGGRESILNNGRCVQYDGFLPAQSLGLSETDEQGYLPDGWGRRSNRIRYAIAQQAYVSSGGEGCSQAEVNGVDISREIVGATPLGSPLLATPLTKVYKGESPFSESLKRFNLCICDTTPCTLNASGVSAAAVIYSLGANGFIEEQNFSSEEAENINQNRFFVSHAKTLSFDDLLVWVSSEALWGALHDAGRLN